MGRHIFAEKLQKQLKNIEMKTLTKSTIAILAVLFLSTNMFANIFEMEQEQYINDIPFNTEKIASQTILENALNEEFTLSEEDINDIPFNTYEVASEKMYELAMAKNFDIEEETFVEDIPFDTQLVVSQSADSSSFIANK